MLALQCGQSQNVQIEIHWGFCASAYHCNHHSVSAPHSPIKIYTEDRYRYRGQWRDEDIAKLLEYIATRQFF